MARDAQPTAAAREAEACAERVLAGESLGPAEALSLLQEAENDPWPLLSAANCVRRHFRGRSVHLCSIAPVKLGRCGEDCHWCAQSARWRTGVEPRGLPPVAELVAAACSAADCGAGHFGLVTSGARLAPGELDAVLGAARAIKAETGLEICGSFGALGPEEARRLRDAGFHRYNHNIETSRDHFPSVCTTHTWSDRLKTAEVAREAGLELCSGAIFGIGESDADRVAVATALRELGARVVPLNFLHPIPGTPLAGAVPLAPLKILSIVAVFRLLLPDRTIKLAGGREHNLRDLQALMFMAGADACLVGGYLTTTGRPAEVDLRMIRDLGLEPARPVSSGRPGAAYA